MKVYIELDEAEAKVFQVVFDDRSIQTLLNRQAARAEAELLELLQRRYYYSVTGAMRWSESQEARIRSVYPFTAGELT